MFMAQSRNPSERNKVGEKKKGRSWLDALVDVSGDIIGGVASTAADNFGRVADFGGNMVKGLTYDPVRWAMENPDEVAKTFVNPQRATDWLTDNLLAGREIENMVRGQGGLENPILAAMALFPGVGMADDAAKVALKSAARGVADDAAKAALKSAAGGVVDDAAEVALKGAAKKIKPEPPAKFGYKLDEAGNIVPATMMDVVFNPENILKSFNDKPRIYDDIVIDESLTGAARQKALVAAQKKAEREAKELAARTEERLRAEALEQLRGIMPAEVEAFESGALNPYLANDARLRRMAIRGEEIAQGNRGGFINAATGEVNRPFESPLEDIGATRSVDPAQRGPRYGADNYALPRPAQPAGEADALLEALEIDKQTLARGSSELDSLIRGLIKMEKNAKVALKPIQDIEKQLKTMIDGAETTAEKVALRRIAKNVRENVLIPMQKKAVDTRMKRAEPKRVQTGYEEMKGK